MSADLVDETGATLTQLPFPPVTKSHILNCSYHSWHPKYRGITPKARLVPLPDTFLEYLRADGIVIPPEENDRAEWSDNDSGIFSAADNDADSFEEDNDPSAHWRETHEEIQRVIDELGGKVAPKLNWSAPKDATWINATNSMQCTSPNDIYLLLKSSDFIAHDLQHAFDDTVDENVQTSPSNTSTPNPVIRFHLVMRKWILLNPAVEFRVFVRNKKIIAVCQRDLNFFDFLFQMREKLLRVILKFFDDKIRNTFPDQNYTFDVYIPPPHDRVWLVDFNPWAPRTDPLLFSWLELLSMQDPPDNTVEDVDDTTNDEEEEEDIEELDYLPELRLVKRDDPEAYSFSTPQYSAHKLPLDVVNAASVDGDLREFANKWEEAKRLAEQQRDEDSDTE
ncbi:cell division cycle protein-like protein [Dendryphion nanum]|uniref:Cell division cycle protein-like protein n=1 Tax=Dendryphion nanum TaxID=256645 RepID=A0A9P9IM51_9PLEO|nr:cell division cycle protein-like protein [Dendryphion nanum]